MKKGVALLFAFFFVGLLTDALPLATYFAHDYICPRCKMKMERGKDCPCHKNKTTTHTVFQDPCGDAGDDFHVSFNRFEGVVAQTQILFNVVSLASELSPFIEYEGLPFEPPHPPPRRNSF